MPSGQGLLCVRPVSAVLSDLRAMLDGELKQFVRPAQFEFRANVFAMRFDCRRA